MSGKQSKRERKLEREAAREAARKRERQRTIFTGIVIAIVVLIGGVLVAISIDDSDDLADVGDEPSPTPTPTASGPTAEERPVACGGQEPPNVGVERPTFEAPDEVLEEDVDYHAVVETTCGRVVLDLGEDTAPEAVNSFAFLAQQGFFDGLEIFRNAQGIGALQTGSGTDDAGFQIGYQLTDELETAQSEGYPPGSVAMANSGENTAGSQFFFVYNESFDTAVSSGSLQPVYTNFATVIEGLDVLRRIGEIPVGGARGETPQERVYLTTVSVGGPEIVEEAPPTPAPSGSAAPSPAASAASPAPTAPTPTD